MVPKEAIVSKRGLKVSYPFHARIHNWLNFVTDDLPLGYITKMAKIKFLG
jgi:hypothetical protein